MSELLNEKKYLVTIDKNSITEKPSKHSNIYGVIQNRINQRIELSINQFSELIQPPNSYTWSGSLFEGIPSNDNWISQEVFGVDFDNDKDLNINEEGVINRLKEYGITPNLLYYTLSNSKDSIWPRFRIVFFLDTPIISKDIHSLIVSGFKLMFKEADPMSFSIHRIFLGGNNAKVYSKEPVKLLDLVTVSSIHIQGNDKGRSRNIKDTLSRSSFFSVNNDKNGKKGELLLCNNNNYQKIPKPVLERIDFKKLKGKVMIFDEFLRNITSILSL